MTGRPKKPTNVRIAEGVRGHRPLNESEPQPTPNVPNAPIGLSAWGKKIWRDTVEELDRLSLLTVIDHAAMHAAIIGADNAHSADQMIRILLTKINNGKGEQEDFYRLSIVNSVSKKGWQQFKAFAVEFGMTPASRTRLSTDQAPAVAARTPSGKKMDPIEQAVCGSLPN
jgi:P27 family predicted phage terminase small subunit